MNSAEESVRATWLMLPDLQEALPPHTPFAKVLHAKKAIAAENTKNTFKVE